MTDHLEARDVIIKAMDAGHSRWLRYRPLTPQKEFMTDQVLAALDTEGFIIVVREELKDYILHRQTGSNGL